MVTQANVPLTPGLYHGSFTTHRFTEKWTEPAQCMSGNRSPNSKLTPVML